VQYINPDLAVERKAVCGPSFVADAKYEWAWRWVSISGSENWGWSAWGVVMVGGMVGVLFL